MTLRLLFASILLAASGLAATGAQAAIKHTIDIPAQGLGPALAELARQTGIQLIYPADLVAGLNTHALAGSMTPEDALDRLLSETSLRFEFLDARTVTLSREQTRITVAPALPAHEHGTSSSAEYNERLRLAQAQPPSGPGDAEATPPEKGSTAGLRATDDAVELGEVVVTGTHIKGVQDQFSPVTQIRRDEMDLAGFANVSDVFNHLPQNFGGGVTTDTVTAGQAVGPGGSSINLRGLGNEATLILLNGRRLAPAGLQGNFVDISSIPTAAVDRIEVMTDGASSLYGSDAIAGVVNIILRDDFAGAESRLRLSTIGDGGGDAITAGQTFGFGDDRGYGLLTYEYSDEDELDANDKTFAQHALDPTLLLPANRKHSAFASAGAQLSDRIRLSADGYYNERTTKAFNSLNTFSLVQRSQDVETQQLGGAAGVNLQLGGEWETDLTAAYSKSDHFSDTIQLHTPTGAGNIDSATSEFLSADATLGGPLFRVTNEATRSIFGVHYRSENVDQLQTNRLTGTPTAINVERTRDVFAVYGELYAPLVAAADEVAGARRLALTFAARYDDYSDFGSSFDPRAGAVWSPIEGLSFRGTYGTSFRAPRIDQLRDAIAVALLGVYADPASPTGQSIALAVTGATSDLDPEEATTWSVGFDFAPPRFERFRLHGTYFSTDYSNRLGVPSRTLDSAFRFANFTGAPVRNPSPALIQSLVSSAQSFTNFATLFPSLGPLSIADVTVLLDQRLQNTLTTKIEGVDFEMAYKVASEFGDWAFQLNFTTMTKFDERFSPVTSVVDLLDTFANPVDLKFRAGAMWNARPLAAALYINYVDDYLDDEAPSGPREIRSWTTVDASLQIDLGHALQNRITDNTLLSFSIMNVFNYDPPAIGLGPLRSVFYDAANADPAGRRAAILLTKRW